MLVLGPQVLGIVERVRLLLWWHRREYSIVEAEAHAVVAEELGACLLLLLEELHVLVEAVSVLRARARALIFVIVITVLGGGALLGGGTWGLLMPTVASRDHAIVCDSLLLGRLIGPVDLDRLAAAIASLSPPWLEANRLASQIIHVSVRPIGPKRLWLLAIVEQFTKLQRRRIIWPTRARLPPLRAHERRPHLVDLLQLARHLSTDVNDWLKNIWERYHGLFNLHPFVALARASLALLLLPLPVLLPRALVPRRRRASERVEQPTTILWHLLSVREAEDGRNVVVGAQACVHGRPIATHLAELGGLQHLPLMLRPWKDALLEGSHGLEEFLVEEGLVLHALHLHARPAVGSGHHVEAVGGAGGEATSVEHAELLARGIS